MFRIHAATSRIGDRLPTGGWTSRVACVLLCAFSSIFAAESRNERARADEVRRPSFLVIVTDDQRWDALGAAGNPIVRTPYIDALAADGVLFTNAFCTTSICAISRACLLTGQYERRHGIDDFTTPLTAEQFANTFPALLRASGYRTGMVGKWGLGDPLPADEYDYFKGYPGQGSYFPKGKQGVAGEHLTDKLGAQAVDFLDGCTAKQPFVLQLNTKAPHCQDGDPWQFQPDPRYNGLFSDVTIPRTKTASELHFAALPEFLKDSEARKRWHLRFEGDELFQKSVRDYYRLIAGVDDVVGRLMERLREKGLDENTVVIYTSDNGFYLGEHGLAGKWFMHEESIRLPLIVHDPRAALSLRGKTVDELALNIDIAPTILAMAGVEIPAVMQGKNLAPLLDGKSIDWRRDFLYEHRFAHPRIPKTEGVRTDRWKYTRYTSVDPVYEELFDLKNDPGEERNLAGESDHAGTLERLRDRCRGLAREAE